MSLSLETFTNIARARRDADILVDSATGNIRVKDNENVFDRVITWVRDKLRHDPNRAETRQTEMISAYNRFLRSVADDIRYKEQTEWLTSAIAADIYSGNIKPLNTRRVRELVSGLEARAQYGANSRLVADYMDGQHDTVFLSRMIGEKIEQRSDLPSAFKLNDTEYEKLGKDIHAAIMQAFHHSQKEVSAKQGTEIAGQLVDRMLDTQATQIQAAQIQATQPSAGFARTKARASFPVAPDTKAEHARKKGLFRSMRAKKTARFSPSDTIAQPPPLQQTDKGVTDNDATAPPSLNPGADNPDSKRQAAPGQAADNGADTKTGVTGTEGTPPSAYQKATEVVDQDGPEMMQFPFEEARVDQETERPYREMAVDVPPIVSDKLETSPAQDHRTRSSSVSFARRGSLRNSFRSIAKHLRNRNAVSGDNQRLLGDLKEIDLPKQVSARVKHLIKDGSVQDYTALTEAVKRNTLDWARENRMKKWYDESLKEAGIPTRMGNEVPGVVIKAVERHILNTQDMLDYPGFKAEARRAIGLHLLGHR